MKNTPLPALLRFGLGMPSDRLVIRGASPDTRYSMVLISPGLDTKPLAPALELDFAAEAGMTLSQITTEEDASILQCNTECHCVPNSSRFEIRKHVLALQERWQAEDGQHHTRRLAARLEDALRVPVLDEAGVSGEFDAEFTLSQTRTSQGQLRSCQSGT